MELTVKEQNIKDDLIQISQRLFQQYGYVKTTMEDISKAARKSKTTLYQYFKNKEEVLRGVIAKERNELYAIVIRESSKGKTSAERLRIYMKTILNEAKDKLFLYALLKGELDVIPFNTNMIKKELDTLDMEEVTNILRNGILMKEFSSHYYEYITSIAYYLVNAMRGLMLQLVLDNTPIPDIDDDYNLDVILDILLKGLSS